MSLLLLAALAAAPAVATDLSPVIEQLASPSAGDRVAGLRGLERLNAPPLAVRPLLVRVLRDPSDDVRIELARTTAELLGDKGIDILDRLARDPQPRVREAAVRAVCRMWDRSRGRLSCVTAFEDPDSAVRTEVIRALRESFPRDPAAAALFRNALADDSPAVQRAAVFGCQAARDVAAVADLLEVARTASDLAAVPAAEEALASIATPDAVAALASLLPPPPPSSGGRPSAEVRAAAARALARMNAPQAAALLRGRLDDRDVTVLQAAMEGLLRLRDAGAVPAITARLRHPDPGVRRFALRALGQLGDPSCAREVRRVMLRDSVPRVRASAVLTYLDVLGVKAVPGLAEVRRDPEIAVRLEAAAALAGLGRPACSTLATFVADPDVEVRALAVSGLGQTGDASHVPVLARAAQTPHAPVRAAVARALGRIGSPEGVPVLARLAADRDAGVRAASAAGLGAIGGPQTTRPLQALARDPVPRVRAAAARALSRTRVQ